jgi:suppressor of fused-like protein
VVSLRHHRDDPGVAGPGTRAIDRHVDRVDASPEEHRYRPRAPHRFQGGGPLHEVTTHRLRQPDHWHLVTYGLSELDAKESDDPGRSGWGFELTFRLAVGTPNGAADGPEPLWAVDLLTNLAAYVWTSGHPFAAGHQLDLSGPIRIDGGGDLTAAVIVVDPTLATMRGPHGTVEFLQVVALTADELELCRSWNTARVVELLARRDALFVTDLDRRSILSDPATAAEVGRAAREEGSALTELRVASLRWRSRPFGPTVAELGAGASAALGPALRRELIGAGSSFRVVGDQSEVRFAVADAATWSTDGALLRVDVPLDEVDGLAGLFDGRTGWGRRPAWSGLRWRVVP